MTVETVKRQSEAHGAHCATCNQVFNSSTSPYWSWTKSAGNHRSGTGHKVEMYRIVVA